MSTHRYEAFWIPGLDTDFDADEALRLGFEWLEDSPHSPVIAMNAATMVHNRPLLESAGARYPVVSQRTRRWSGGRSPHAVLAVWPTVETLEFAEGLAFNGGLCVIPGTLDEMSPWIARTGALNLADPEATLPSGPSLPADMKHDLDLTLGFDGRKQFLGGGGKEPPFEH